MELGSFFVFRKICHSKSLFVEIMYYLAKTEVMLSVFVVFFCKLDCLYVLMNNFFSKLAAFFF